MIGLLSNPDYDAVLLNNSIFLHAIVEKGPLYNVRLKNGSGHKGSEWDSKICIKWFYGDKRRGMNKIKPVITDFKEWLKKEMASFMIPNSLQITVPIGDNIEKVIGVDMLFEKDPKTIDKFSFRKNVMNQGSKFIAKVPYGSKYFVYNGFNGISDHLISKEKAKELEQEYNILDDNWWKKAMVIGSDMEQLNLSG